MFLDVFVLIIIVISALVAFFRGFIREALTVITLILAITGAYFLGPYLVPGIEGWLSGGAEAPDKIFGILPVDITAQILSRASVFFTIVLALSITTHFLAEFIQSIGLGAVDRSLGVAFGLVRAIIVILILYLPLYLLVEPEVKDKWFADSKTHFYIEKGSGALASLLPEDLLKERFDEIQKAANENENVIDARQKLKDMDLLREDLSAEERAALIREKYESGELQKIFEGEGYSDEFRAKIDQVFEDNADVLQGITIPELEPKNEGRNVNQ